MLLAIDTSTTWIGLALYDGHYVAAEETWRCQGHHTVELAPALDALFKRTGIAPGQLKAIGVATGPGSFTSLRIGLALAKGLGLAMHLPLIGVPTLDVTAASQPPSNLPMAVVLQAGRGRFALLWYRCEKDHWVADGEAKVITLAEFIPTVDEPAILCGELSAEDRQAAHKNRKLHIPGPAQCLRRPSFLAELAWKRWQAGQVDEPVSLAPIYLHISDPIPDV